MIIEARIIPPYGLCDWAVVQVNEGKKVNTVNVFVPLAEKKHPNLSTDDAVRQVAIERFKIIGSQFLTKT